MLVFFYVYAIVAYQFVDATDIILEDTSIVIENYPESEWDVDIYEWEKEWEEWLEEIIVEEIIWETATGDNNEKTGIDTWIVLRGEVLFEEILSWTHLGWGEDEKLSWCVDELNIEVAISDDVVGVIDIESWSDGSIDLSDGLLHQHLLTIYPTQQIELNMSWYVILDTLKFVVTTWWESWVTYCSRITNENIASILKAGIRTWRKAA